MNGVDPRRRADQPPLYRTSTPGTDHDAVELFLFGDRVVLGVVFLVSAATKLTGRGAVDAFVASVRALPFVALRWARPVSVALVGVEVLVTGLLLMPATVGYGFLLATGLLLVLTGGVVAALATGTRTPCRCFGASQIPLGRRHVVRNLALTALAVAGGLAVLGGSGTPWADVRSEPVALAVAGAVGLVSAIVVIVFDEVVELFAAGVRDLAPHSRPARPAAPRSR